jgi:hypothetical protein
MEAGKAKRLNEAAGGWLTLDHQPPDLQSLMIRVQHVGFFLQRTGTPPISQRSNDGRS